MPPKQQKAAMVMPSESDDDQMMGDPGGALRKYMNTNFSKEFLSSLPEKVWKRVQVLLKYHEEQEALSRQLEDEETALFKEYDAACLPLFERRKEIITGASLPTEEEVAAGFPEGHKGEVDIMLPSGVEASGGLPGFWLKALKHHVVFASMIEEHDEEVLKHLIDISSNIIDGDFGSFAVTFTFEPNDYLAQNCLTLAIVMSGKEATLARQPVQWKPGKDVTVHTVTKKQRAKRTGAFRTISRTESRPSFFTIFQQGGGAGGDKDEGSEEDEDDDDDEEQICTLLQLLRTRLIPGAVQFYTGEAPDGSDEVEDDDEEEEEEESDEEPMMPIRGRGRGRARH